MNAKSLIDRWPSIADFAADAGASYDAVKQWRARNSIPPAYFSDIADGARRRRITGVTLKALYALKKKESEAA